MDLATVDMDSSFLDYHAASGGLESTLPTLLDPDFAPDPANPLAGNPLATVQVLDSLIEDDSYPVVNNLQHLREDTATEYLTALYNLQPMMHASQSSAPEIYQACALQHPEAFSNGPRAHVDGGSMINLSKDITIFWHLRPLPPEQHPKILAADKLTTHEATHVGYFRVPAQTALGYTMERAFYTPTIDATILAPDVMAKTHGCAGYTAVSMFGSDCSLRLVHCKRSSGDLYFRLNRYNGLLFSDPLIKPVTDADKFGPFRPPALSECQVLPSVAASISATANTDCSCTLAPKGCPCKRPAASDPLAVPYCAPVSSSSSVAPTETPTETTTDDESSIDSHFVTCTDPALSVHALTRNQLRILWHQRLGHLHSRRASDLHRFVVGVPSLPIATELDNCPVCARAKLRKADRSKVDSKHATVCNQGISVDFGFLVQRSSDSKRVSSLSGLNGETCYVLIADHYSGTLYGDCRPNKSPPIDYLNRWLAQHGLPKDHPDKYVRLDLGGELGRCPEIVALFENAGYRVETTSAMGSHANGPVERPHQTVCNGMRAMLDGAGLPPKFWPYAFHHFLRLYNSFPHGDRPASAYTMCTGKQPNLTHLKTFGCRVYALPARPRRPDRLVSDACTGIFLGYAKSLRHALYYDIATQTVKTTQHLVFDELFNEDDPSDRPPNARLLSSVDPADLGLDVTDVDTDPTFDVDSSPFTKTVTFNFPLDLDDPDCPFGLEFSKCDRYLRAFASGIHRSPSGHKIRAFRKHYLGSYVLSIADTPVFTLEDIDLVYQKLLASSDSPTTVPIVLAPARKSDFDSRESALHLRVSDLRRVAALRAVSGEGASSTNEFSAAVSSIETSLNSLAPEDLSQFIYRLQTAHMTDEERQLKSLTRCNLKRLSNWDQWDAAFDKQLDNHLKAGTIGKAIEWPRGKQGRDINILRAQWSNFVKTDGTRKTRCCLDGSQRSAPWLREFAATYASCIETPCMRLFFALCASLGFVVSSADTDNAYQQAPGPSVPCYLQVDDAIASWYKKRFGIDLDPSIHVIPVHKALQGHPEAGALWENMIVGILDDLDFTSTTHERNLYVGKIDGELVLVCRQVDDFAIGSCNPETAKKLVSHINEHATTSYQGNGDSSPRGLHLRYNGLDVYQTRDYIKIGCDTYIDRVLQTHGWDSPNHKESDRHDTVPMSSLTHDKLQQLVGPEEKTAAHKELEEKVGFSYRQLLGELVYAYVLCRPDIGYAVTFLSRFAAAPDEAHYLALKQVCKYLRATKHWGIIYWRPEPLETLPAVPLEQLDWDSSLPPFPPMEFMKLVGFVDSALANCIKTRRSVTGFVFCFAGGAIAYKSKLQAVVATSSTEAEFVAAVHAAKVAKYLRMVLKELGFEQQGPTILHEDNKAAIDMINSRKPTPRSRHIDIQHFAIQEWKRAGDIKMEYIPTTVNMADQATKILGWILHSRHARRAMGHYGM